MWEETGGSWLVYIAEGTMNYGTLMWPYLHQCLLNYKYPVLYSKSSWVRP